MTVGIAAVCESNANNPKVVIAADRMVTSGRVTKIEYEHTKTKIEAVHDDDVVKCMGVTAGDISLSDDFFLKLNSRLDDNDPMQVEDIVDYAVDSYQDIITEAVNRQVLGPFNITLDELTSDEVSLESGTVQALMSDILDKKNEIVSNMNILLTGVDPLGTTLCSIPDGDVARHDSIGYHAIGSGRQPARTSFIRSEYDTFCSLDNALLSVVEAKTQSEGAQGVGEKMYIAIIDQDGCYQFGNSEIKDVVGLYDMIQDSEQDARKTVIEDEEYIFERSNNED